MKKVGCGIALGALAVAAVGVGFVLFNKPDKVKNPCWRTFHRKDGRPKVAFKSAMRANLQSVRQFVFHGEVCNPYEANGMFYTGHSSRPTFGSLRTA